LTHRAHAPAARAVQVGIDICEREHGAKLLITAALEAALTPELLRVAEAAEDDVPQRQVGKVVAVQAEAVMHAMRFRPLDQIAQPLWRADIPVLEEGIEAEEAAGEGRGHGV